MFVVWLFAMNGNAQATGTLDGPSVQITDSGLPTDEDSYEVQLAVQVDNVYAVWRDKRPVFSDPDFGQIYFAKSEDGGKTWGANLLIGNPSVENLVWSPDIIVLNDGTIVIVYYLRNTPCCGDGRPANDIMVSLSEDGGETFTEPPIKLLDGDDDNNDYEGPLIVVDESDGYLYLLHTGYQYLDAGDQGYNMSLTALDFTGSGNGTTHQNQVNDVARSGRGIDTPYGSSDEHPDYALAARNGKVCVAWDDKRDLFSIYGACSTDNGATFGENFRISESGNERPKIAIKPDGTLIAIYHRTNDSAGNIIFRRSTDNGQTWEEEKQLTTVNPTVWDYDLQVSNDGQILVVWIQEERNGNEDVYLSGSVDDGETWSLLRMDHDIDSTVDIGFGLSLVTEGSGETARAHVAWHDERSARYDYRLYTQAVILDATPPTIPENFEVMGEDNSILLTWDAVSDDGGVTNYKVYRATSSAGPFTEIAPLGVHGTFYRDVGLINGETYYYQVAAVDGSDNTGSRTAPTSGTAIVGTGVTPGGLIAFNSGKDIHMRDLPNVDNLRTFASRSVPYFNDDGSRFFYFAGDKVLSEPLAGGESTLHFQRDEAYNAYDVTSDGTFVAAVVGNQIVAQEWTCFNSVPFLYERGTPIFTDGSAQSFDIGVSWSGTWLAYTYEGWCTSIAISLGRSPQFCMVNSETGDKNCLSDVPIYAPDFSARGTRMVFEYKLDGQSEIWTADVHSTGALINLTQITHSIPGQHATEPAFSSDGQWIIFQRDMDLSEEERYELFIVKVDGTGVRPLDIEGTNPAWHNGVPAAPLEIAPSSVSTEPIEPTQIGMVSGQVVRSTLLPLVLFAVILLFTTGQVVRKKEGVTGFYGVVRAKYISPPDTPRDTKEPMS